MKQCKFIYPILICLFVISCKQRVSQNIKPEMEFSGSKWIGTEEILPATDSLFYEEAPAPIFRKEFHVGKDLQSAKLYITAAGYYKATLNGNRIGINYLDPAWTDFGKRIYFSEYDLTSELKEGDNCLGVILGNGFYNPLPLKMWGRINIREALTCAQPAFIAKLKLVYKNGEYEEIISDNSWKFAKGPILKNSVYLGELYDARQEISDWNLVGFNDQKWQQANVDNGPGGKLQKAFFPPIQITKTIRPVSISSLENDKWLVDMGVNFSGLYRIKMQGKRNDTVKFRLGERVYENGRLNSMTTVTGQIKRPGVGGAGAPAIAEQTETYIFGDEQFVTYQPEFTFHTFRYIEISGLQEKPKLSDIEGLAMNSNVENRNQFSCSSDLINSIQEATERTFLANMMSVQSDCAAREKFGYGGDLNATAEAFIYNFNMQDFYRKTIYDWDDAINDSNFVDTAPYVGINYCGISWESAFLTTQYNLFLYYNDRQIIDEFYEKDLRWMEKVARLHPEGIVKSGLSDHEALIPVPVELTGTGHYLECARIMKRFAKEKDDVENEQHFVQLENKLTKILLDTFWYKPIEEGVNKQTVYATLIYYNVIPKKELEKASNLLVQSVKEAPARHFTTGIFGTKYILEALSKTGHADLVHEIVNSKLYPGWGFMIDNGATTIWETWKESDNTFSNCHPMFGSVSEWFYKWLGGIQMNTENPGFKKFYINPVVPKDLNEVSTTYYSPYGKIVSNWKNNGNIGQVYEIEIPKGSSARITVPVGPRQNVSIIKDHHEKILTQNKIKSNRVSYELESGKYKFFVK